MLRHVLVTTVSVEEQTNITHSEFVSVALFMQYAKRMRHVILSSVASQAKTLFFHIIS
jgi:hypothetical protein